MEALFLLLITFSLAAGIYGSVLQSGANIVRLDRRMTLTGFAVGAIQLGASVLGYLIGKRVLLAGIVGDGHRFWARVLGGVLLAFIGVRMLMRAFQRKTFLEHRIERIDMKKDVLADLQLCVYSALAGAACGLLSFHFLLFLLLIFLFALFSAIGGYISGRANGAEHAPYAYALGGGLLCAVSLLIQFAA